MHPLPTALRLSTVRPVSRLPRPPFGLPAWSSEGAARAVLLHVGAANLDDVGSLLSQIPRASALPSGTPTVLLGLAFGGVGVWRRLVAGGTVHVPRATRCTALVMLGYVEVGGGIDDSTGSDLAWGWSP
jgi:hypothetical protein